ncbi:Poly-gamma-glutamate biosynthesis protein PgsC/CapC [Sulfidibacter corallicola]|uniref:Poly-gamma-glutamate biosynthesis protein PgsC/CapC n=1 Tax=Sulfidibacter corallicola TaxID=2818388 RepID=A0A8A4TWP3_SULCO|nr:poly-gamma-glutamate biosynthesis protein PgsC/CapC [Sulfidibacter corallicola]QTD53903.1 poly-gamma-glutamate biosynthesis protein PgsC/CapC [Sulfidibacter corallicola]
MDVVIHIFPAGSLSESVITTVWLGIWVIVFFNQWLGWSLSGLIVPGYLVPLIVLKPLSAAVIGIEGLFTYVVAWILFQMLPRSGLGFGVFGRDRFLVLILISVATRIFFDGYLLPEVVSFLDERFRIPFEYRTQFHSFGLIIVALLANYFWRPGLRKGLLPMAITLLVTYALVRFVLLPYTNFTISNVEYMYEDLAGDILAAPKAYIILLTAAFIASRMNLLYGWEFNGILVPSLMALLWYQPAKLLISLLEAGVVLGLGMAVLSTPLFRGITIEGGRKLLLFFNISFFYKMVLGFALAAWKPELKTTDFFGIGYLITTLLAVKMHEKDILVPMTRATLQVSLVAALFANGLGYLLTFLPKDRLAPEGRPARVIEATGTLRDLPDRAKLLLYAGNTSDDIRKPALTDMDHFTRAIQELTSLSPDPKDPKLRAVRQRLALVGYALEVVARRYFYLYEDGVDRGWGLYLLDTRPRSDLLIEVPAPLEEALTFESGLALMTRLGARALAVNSLSSNTAQAVAFSPTQSYQSFYTAFFREVGRNHCLQVRGLGIGNQRLLALRLADFEPGGDRSSLFLKVNRPKGVTLADLEGAVGESHLYFHESPFDNLHRDLSTSGYGELFLSKRGMRRLLALEAGREGGRRAVAVRSGETVAEAIEHERRAFAEAGSGAYRPASRELLLLLEDEVLLPLMTLIGHDQDTRGQAIAEELDFIAGRARPLGYELARLDDPETGEAFVLLREAPDAARTHRGFCLFRLGPAHPFGIQVPRPVFEHQSLAFGSFLFRRLQARVLMVHGAHHLANPDLSADPLQAENSFTVFNQVHQSVLASMGSAPFLMLQIRGLGHRDFDPYTRGDLLLAFDRGTVTDREQILPLQIFLDRMEADGLGVGFVDGKPDTAGYGLGANPQALFMAQAPHQAMIQVRVAASLRRSFRSLVDSRRFEAQFRALDIPATPLDIEAQFGQAQTAPLDSASLAVLEHYLAHYDITALARLVAMPDLRVQRLDDTETGQVFLLVAGRDGTLYALANLGGRGAAIPVSASPDMPLAAQVAHFVAVREPLLLLGGTP